MRTRRTRSRLLAALVLSALVTTACGARGASTGTSGGSAGGAAPGITDTEVKIGGTFPLSGPLAANGTAASGGVKAYLESVNEAGGVQMGDGKTRKVTLVTYDDGYDPAKAVQNYQKLVTQDRVFALLQSFGTPPNLAIMANANRDQVPQLFVHSGAALFSADQQKNPWTIGWQPTYQSEGEASGKYLAGQDKPVRVAVLSQNDDFGKAFVEGFERSIAGSQVQVVARQTYEPTDPTVDAQVSNLAGSKADVLFAAVAIPRLAAGAITRSRDVGWNPQIHLVSVVSSLDQVVKPAGATESDDLFSLAFVKTADNAQYADAPDVREYFQRMEKHASGASARIVNAEYGYGSAATFVEALKLTKQPTRQALMDAVHQLKGQQIPLLLPGVTIDGSSRTAPPLQGVVVQQLRGGKWNTVS